MKQLIDNNPYITLMFDTFINWKEAADTERKAADSDPKRLQLYISRMDCIKELLFECEYRIEYNHADNSYSLHRVKDEHALIHDYRRNEDVQPEKP